MFKFRAYKALSFICPTAANVNVGDPTALWWSQTPLIYKVVSLPPGIAASFQRAYRTDYHF